MTDSAVETPAAEMPALIKREFEVQLEEGGDGRTLVGRCVPYNVSAVVADPPFFQPYREMWMPGVFDHQLRAANRILLDFEHQPGIGDVIGRALEVTSSEDGFNAEFKVYDNADGDKALQMYHDGVLTSLSVLAKPMRSKTAEDGTVQRVKAHLDRVALCRQGAFEDAKVLAVRTEPVIIDPLPPLPDELSQRLNALGVEPITRLAVSKRPWDGSPSRFTDEEYQRACLIDRGGDGSPKERCSLPVLEPDGALNVNALGTAAAALAGARTPLANVSADARSSAARKLLRYYRVAQMTPPASLVAMARERLGVLGIPSLDRTQ